MNWTSIITIILQLISAIFGIDLSGILGGIVKPTANDSAYVRCADAAWTQEAAVRGGVFSGTVQVVCELQTAGNGDIATLEANLAALNTTYDGSVTYGDVQPVSYGGGLDGHVRNVAFKTAKGSIKGQAELVSDGETELHRNFVSTGKDAAATSQYLKEVTQQIEVTASLARGNYRVVITTGAQIAKPFLVSSSSFLNTLKQQLLDRANGDAPALVTGLSTSL